MRDPVPKIANALNLDRVLISNDSSMQEKVVFARILAMCPTVGGHHDVYMRRTVGVVQIYSITRVYL